MSKKLKKYELLKDLVLYPAGTIVYHEYEVLPSQYNSGNYSTAGNWYTKEHGHEVNASNYLKYLVEWCIGSHRNDDHHEEWVKSL